MGVENTLIPVRFLVIIVHFMLAVMIFFSRKENIEAGLPTNYNQDEYNEADSSMVAALSLMIICIAVEITGLFLGFSMFRAGVNCVSILGHFSASILLSLFITHEWHYMLLWIIFGTLSAPFALLELIVILRTLLRKGSIY